MLTQLQITELANAAYMDPKSIPAALGNDWVVADTKNDTNSGYLGVLLYNNTTNTYALVTAGTNDANDLVSDTNIVAGNLPTDQLQVASKFAIASKANIAAERPGADLIFVGHSLGGTISELLGALGLGHVSLGGSVVYGVDNPSSVPLLGHLPYFAAQNGLPYDATAGASVVANGQYLIADTSFIGLGKNSSNSTQVSNLLGHGIGGFIATESINQAFIEQGYTGVTSKTISQQDAITYGIPDNAFALHPSVSVYFDATGSVIGYAQIELSSSGSNSIGFYSLNSGVNPMTGCFVYNSQTSQIISETKVCTAGTMTTTSVDYDGNGTFDFSQTQDAISGTASVLTQDLGNNGSVDNRYLVNNGQTYNLKNVNEAITADNIFGNFMVRGCSIAANI